MIERFTEQPKQAEEDAGRYKIVSYHHVRDLRELKTCLHHGYPVSIGIKVYESSKAVKLRKRELFLSWMK